VDRTIQLFGLRVQAGSVVQKIPGPTPLNWLDSVIEKIDLILVMSSIPAFGGQSYPQALPNSPNARADRGCHAKFRL